MRAGLRSRPWAGLDVGSFSLKLLATHGPGSGARWLAEVPLPASENGERRPADVVARAILDALTQAGLGPRGLRGITMGISGTDVIIKQISLPLIEDAEVAGALRFEARKHLPFDPQAMVIDYQILGRYLTEKKLDVLLAAVSSDHLDQHLEPLRLLDLEVDIVDATPLALTNALLHSVQSTAEPLALLDIGHNSSHLTIWHRGEPFFGRRLEFGGRTLTQAISREIRIPIEEAEEWKLAAGSPASGLRVDWEMPEMQAILGSLQRDLGDELRRSIAFYRTLGRLPETLPLRVSGGTARLPGLVKRLSELLGGPVELFDPVGESDPEVAAPQFTQAFGLALRTA
jgi:type IV pilus assembly protein PilM